jgi:cytoskeletal protein CcmA (bactofilin family)
MFSKPNKPPAHHRASPSIIGANCSLAGDIASDGEVHVDGKVVGDVRCVTLVIGEEGGVTGEIEAETVRVLGAVTGQITARAVELAKTARITGDITHETLSVEAGAFVEGRFNRLATEGAEPARGLEPAVIKMAAIETGVDISPGEKEAHGQDSPKANVIMLGN